MITLAVLIALAVILPLLALAMVTAAGRRVCGPWDRVTPEQARAALPGSPDDTEMWPSSDQWVVGIPEPRTEGE